MTTPKRRTQVSAAVAAHLERLCSSGGRRLSVYLDPAATAALDRLAAHTGASLSAVVGAALVSAARRLPRPPRST